MKKTIQNQQIAQISDKAQLRGLQSMEDVELLALLLDDAELANELLAVDNQSLTSLVAQPISKLRMACGMGLAKGLRLQAAAEIGRRVAEHKQNDFEVVATTEDVLAMFRTHLESINHEECWVLYLTATNRVIERSRVSSGGLQSTVVDVRLIFKRAIELLCARIIVVHNHPSGDARPSQDDVVLTQKIQQGGALIDVILLDHIIISRSGYYSFRGDGELR